MGWDDQMSGIQTIDQVHVPSGEDDQMRSLKTIDQVHVLAGENGIG
jgi:hypothetical protein